MGLAVMPLAELFAHIQVASMNVCAAYRNCTQLGAPFMHIWPAYQICGAKQEICGCVSCMHCMGDAYMYNDVVGACHIGHTWAALGVASWPPSTAS